MVTDKEKSVRKAKATRKANLLRKGKDVEKLNRAKARARKAEIELKAYKQGFKEGVDSQK